MGLCNLNLSRSFPKNLLSAATVCAPAGEATPQRAIRVIHGSLPVSRAPHLHAGPCGIRVPALEVAQVHAVSQLPLQTARFQFSIGEILRFMAHHRFDHQLFGETPVGERGIRSSLISSFSLAPKCLMKWHPSDLAENHFYLSTQGRTSSSGRVHHRHTT